MLLGWSESGQTENYLLMSSDNRLGLKESAALEWDRVHFLHPTCYGLCFGFVLKTLLVMQGCLSYC